MKLKRIIKEGIEQQLEKIVKKYGGELAKKYKGAGIYFKWPSDDSKSKSQAAKAAKHLDRLHTTAPGPDKQKTIEDYEITTVSPTGVHGKVWLWIMV